MALAFRAVATSTATSVTSDAVNKPTGTVSGDIIVTAIFVTDLTGGTTVTPPSGFALVTGSPANTNRQLELYVKVAGGSEPSTYTWSWDESGDVAIIAASYSGGDSTTPYDGSPTPVSGSGSSKTGQFATHYDSTFYIGAFAAGSNGSFGPPSGTTERADINTGGSGSGAGTLSLVDDTITNFGTVPAYSTTSGPGGSPWTVATTLVPSGGTYNSLFRKVDQVAISPRLGASP